MTNNKTYHAAVYLRLSREDGDVADGGKQVSNSIANQKELVMDYLKSHPEITVVSTYTDDGFSGVNFERPEFQRMLSDIREDKIDCDLYRLLEGDADAINSYRGEYMSSYPWASLTEAYVDRVRNHL